MIGKRFVTWARRQLRPASLAVLAVLSCAALWTGERVATGQPIFPYTQDSSGNVTFLFPVFFPNTPTQPTSYIAPQAQSGRVTFTSGTAVMSANVAAAGTVFYTPYNGSMMSLWDGTNWNEFQFSELSNVLANSAVGNAGPAAAVAASCYDLFVWNNGTKTAPILVLTRGPAWTTCLAPGARAAGGALATTNGVVVNAVAITNGPAIGRGVLVGTIATDAGGATVTFNQGGNATAAVVNLFSWYNRVPGTFRVTDNGANYGYTTATIRQARANAYNQVTVLAGDGVMADPSNVTVSRTLAVATAAVQMGLGMNSTTAFLCAPSAGQTVAAATMLIGITNRCPRQILGQAVFSALELGDGANANLFDFSSSNELQVAIQY